MEQQIDLLVAEYVRTGIARIPKWQIYAAYEAQRLRENVWRDIKERIRDQGGSWQQTRVIETDADIVFVKENSGSLLSSKV